MNFFFSSRRRHTFFFQAEDGIRDRSPSRGLGDVYKRQLLGSVHALEDSHIKECILSLMIINIHHGSRYSSLVIPVARRITRAGVSTNRRQNHFTAVCARTATSCRSASSCPLRELSCTYCVIRSLQPPHLRRRIARSSRG